MKGWVRKSTLLAPLLPSWPISRPQRLAGVFRQASVSSRDGPLNPALVQSPTEAAAAGSCRLFLPFGPGAAAGSLTGSADFSG
jgi:hypothetical protein